MGLFNSFILSKIWVFKKSQDIKFNRSFFIFLLIYILGALEMALLINILVSLIGNYQIAWFFGAFVAAVNNFLGSKYFVFEK